MNRQQSITMANIIIIAALVLGIFVFNRVGFYQGINEICNPPDSFAVKYQGEWQCQTQDWIDDKTPQPFQVNTKLIEEDQDDFIQHITNE